MMQIICILTHVRTQALQKRHMAKKAKKGAAPALPSLDGMVVTPPSRIQHPEHLARLQVCI